MKKMLSILVSFILTFTCITTFSFAGTKYPDSKYNVSDETLLHDIIKKNVDYLSEGNKQIYKLNEYNYNNIINFNSDQIKNIKDFDFYLIKNQNIKNKSNSNITVVADMQVELPATTISSSSGGTEYTTKKCGRVTAYMECAYSIKHFGGRKAIKLNKTGGKITKKENSGLVIRKLKSAYHSKGTSWASSGGSSKNVSISKSKTHTASKYATLQTWDTSSISRYYDTEGGATSRASFYVTYGGTTASSQATYEVQINLCAL